MNVVEGIELHTGLLSPEEQQRVVDSVERWVGLVSRHSRWFTCAAGCDGMCEERQLVAEGMRGGCGWLV